MSTYKVNKSINSEGRRLNFLDSGIHEDVILISIEYKISPNNNPYLVFTFDKDGKKLTHTEYEPKDRDGLILEDKKKNQIVRLKHLATKYVTEEVFDFEADSWESFCQTIISKMTGNFEGKKMRVKVVYSNKNYTGLPKYVPFIESMEVPKEESKLEIVSIDKMKKDAPDKTSDTTSNPFQPAVETAVEPADATSETPQTEDSLPF